MTMLFAFVALLTLLGLTLFQIALIFGAPLGKFAWGGKNKYLPTRLRVASSISIILYILFAAFISSKAGITNFVANDQILNIGMWLFTAYFLVGIGMNAISRSAPERNFMTPVAVILATSFLVVAIS